MQKLCRPISVAFIAALLALTGSCSGGTFSNGSCEAECDVALCMRCENDTCVSACGEEQVCDGAGVCVDAATCDPICDSDECMVCDDGDCVTACEDWEICDEEGHCEEDTSCEPACDADECMVCDHGDCVSACDIGEECDGFGTCVPYPMKHSCVPVNSESLPFGS